MVQRLQAIEVFATQANLESYLIPTTVGVFDVRQGLVMTVSRTWDSETFVVLSTANGLLSFDPDVDDGIFSLNLPQSVVAKWPVGNYVYVLTGIEDGEFREICRGPFIIQPGGRVGDFGTAEPLNLRETVSMKIVARQSAELRRTWRVFDGAPLDMTSYLPFLTLRPTFGYPSRITYWSVGHGLAGDADGFLRLIVSQADGTALLPSGLWTFVLVVGGQQGIFELARGPFEVIPGTV